MPEQLPPSELVGRIVKALSEDERVLGTRERQLVRAIGAQLAAAPDAEARDAGLAALRGALADVVARRLVGGLAAAVTDEALRGAVDELVASDRERGPDERKTVRPFPRIPVNPPPFIPDPPPGGGGHPPPHPPPPPPLPPLPDPVIPIEPIFPPPPPPPPPPPFTDPPPPPIFPPGPIFPEPSVPPIFPGGGIPAPFPIFGSDAPGAGEDVAPPDAVEIAPRVAVEIAPRVAVVDDVVADDAVARVAAFAREREGRFHRGADGAPAHASAGFVESAARVLADVGDLGSVLEDRLAPALGEAVGSLGLLRPVGRAAGMQLVALAPGEGHVLRPPSTANQDAVTFVLALSPPPPGAELRVHAARPAGGALAASDRFQPFALATGRLVAFPAVCVALLVPGALEATGFGDHFLALTGRLEA
jgi:hypothetical protein